MDLQQSSAEFANLTFTALPNGATIEASIDQINWLTVTTSGTNPTTGKVLLRGPLSTQTLGLLVPARSELWIRITANPEIIIRSAGWVDLYS